METASRRPGLSKLFHARPCGCRCFQPSNSTLDLTHLIDWSVSSDSWSVKLRVAQLVGTKLWSHTGLCGIVWTSLMQADPCAGSCGWWVGDTQHDYSKYRNSRVEVQNRQKHLWSTLYSTLKLVIKIDLWNGGGTLQIYELKHWQKEWKYVSFKLLNLQECWFDEGVILIVICL